MSTDFLIRPTIRFERKSCSPQKINGDPLSYQNLSVVKKISEGKFPIYLTTSKISNEKYAMKVYSEGSDFYYKNELRFASLGHPNVLRIMEPDDQRTNEKNLFTRVKYVLSEYAPHGDFFNFITKNKDNIDEKLARTYFRQLIDGLDYLHRIGIAHLDLKPENLLIGEDFNLKIADFDLSYVDGDISIKSGGTRLYRGPEFYNPKPEDDQFESPATSDIYSAGIILFILKSGGVYPHLENQIIEGMNLTELMERNSSKFWSKHTELQGKSDDFFDRKFKSLFRKMTRPNPKNRVSIKKIKKSKWYNGPVYTPEELQIKMKTILNC